MDSVCGIDDNHPCAATVSQVIHVYKRKGQPSKNKNKNKNKKKKTTSTVRSNVSERKSQPSFSLAPCTSKNNKTTSSVRSNVTERKSQPSFSLVPRTSKNKKKKKTSMNRSNVSKRKSPSSFTLAACTSKKKKNTTSIERSTTSCLLDPKHYFPSPVTSFYLSDVSRFHDWITYPLEIEHTYPQGMEGSTLKIIKGTRLEKDVISLLSNDGKRDYLVRNDGVRVPVGSVRGKYLLICCFLVPLLSHEEAAYICRAMIAAYSRLSSMGINFEMVMVAKLTSVTMFDDDEEAAFTRFFNAFPPHCLAIPFSDSESRHFVCKSLGLTDPCDFNAALVLHPDQTVLLTEGHCFVEFGAAAFPFTEQRLDTLVRQDEEFKIRLDISLESARSVLGTIPKDQVDPIISSRPVVSLSELLSCQDSQLLWRFGSLGVEETDTISVADLSKKKCVGLYLCYHGLFMEKLKKYHQDCLARNLEFEIVLVYMPFGGDTNLFFNVVNQALLTLKISSWWVMPFVDDVSRRLWRLYNNLMADELIILADGGKAGGELRGRAVLGTFGLKRYPFTRKKIVEDTLFHLRSLSLASVLSANGSELVSSGGRRVSVSELMGRNVLLYFDIYNDLFHHVSFFYRSFRHYYKRIQLDYPNSEVVFVPLYSMSGDDPVPEMPWLRLPLHDATANSVIKQVLEGLPYWTTLVAFGSDGRILSRRAPDSLDYTDDGGICGLFTDTLREEIVAELEENIMDLL